MPPAKKAAPAAKKSAAPAKGAVQATVTLKHLAATLADSHDLPKKQAEAVLGDLVTFGHPPSEKGRQNPSDGSRHPSGSGSVLPGWVQSGDGGGHPDQGQ